jgi:hypothetical protein
MPFEKKPEPMPPKWQISYEDDECISTWKYNSKINPNGPIEVEYKYKKNFVHPKSNRTMKDLIKDS